MLERALVPDSGRRPRDHRKLADRLQPGTPTQLPGLSDPGGISKRKCLCKCGKQRTLPTFAQPRRRRAYLAAKLNPEHSHLPGLNQGGSSIGMSAFCASCSSIPSPVDGKVASAITN